MRSASNISASIFVQLAQSGFQIESWDVKEKVKLTCVSRIPGPALNRTTTWKPFISKLRCHFLWNQQNKFYKQKCGSKMKCKEPSYRKMSSHHQNQPLPKLSFQGEHENQMQLREYQIFYNLNHQNFHADTPFWQLHGSITITSGSL